MFIKVLCFDGWEYLIQAPGIVPTITRKFAMQENLKGEMRRTIMMTTTTTVERGDAGEKRRKI